MGKNGVSQLFLTKEQMTSTNFVPWRNLKNTFLRETKIRDKKSHNVWFYDYDVHKEQIYRQISVLGAENRLSCKWAWRAITEKDKMFWVMVLETPVKSLKLPNHTPETVNFIIFKMNCGKKIPCLPNHLLISINHSCMLTIHRTVFSLRLKHIFLYAHLGNVKQQTY